MTPSDLHRRIMLAYGAGDSRLFRNNTGLGWVGAVVPVEGGILIRSPRPLHAGLCVGSSDLIGWHSRVITQADVGRRIAQFLAIEAKTGKARPTAQQRAFIAAVLGAGGLAGVARGVDDVDRILRPDHHDPR